MGIFFMWIRHMARGGRQECCRLCYSVSVRLFFHFLCLDSGLALQLTCISALKDNNVNPNRKICRQHLASENALLPQRWWLEVGSIKKKRLWQFSSRSLFDFPPTDQESPLEEYANDVGKCIIRRYQKGETVPTIQWYGIDFTIFEYLVSLINAQLQEQVLQHNFYKFDMGKVMGTF